MPEGRLEALRRELANLDREIFERVARRQVLSMQIGRVKRELDISPRDFRQEKSVVERGRSDARELGFSPALAEELLLLLIRSSLTVQEHDEIRARGGGDDRSALVIGGSGKMGRWFVRFLSAQGFEVAVADPVGGYADVAHTADWRDADLDCDVIVVAAPLGASNRILHDLAERRPPGLVFDIGSLKSPLRGGLQALVAAGVRVTSLHPMFGPDAELLSGRHVVFVDLGVPDATRLARELFDSTMAIQVAMELDHHDRAMAYVLGLSHALNIAFFTALADSDEDVPSLAEISSTTFEAQLAIARRVAGESPDLYFEIQRLNDFGAESLVALETAVGRVREIVTNTDSEAFAELMRRGHDYLATR
jgi:chorismate mutase/prephenate dehydrogenase